MRTCIKCNSEKIISDFNKKKSNKDGISKICRECEKIYTRNHYQNNKQYYINKSHNYTTKVKQWFSEYKSKLKCESCGETHPATFDFHHIDKSKKIDCISVLVAQGKYKILKEELKKCKVLCANCHRKLHWIEK